MKASGARRCKDEAGRKRRSRVGSNLFAFPLNAIEYGLESALREPALLASLLIVLVSRAHSLGSEVECVAKRLMDASQDVSTGHEDLHWRGKSAIETINTLKRGK